MALEAKNHQFAGFSSHFQYSGVVYYLRMPKVATKARHIDVNLHIWFIHTILNYIFAISEHLLHIDDPSPGYAIQLCALLCIIVH